MTPVDPQTQMTVAHSSGVGTPGARQGIDQVSRTYWFWLAGIILLGVGLRVYSFGWYDGMDDRQWVIAAEGFGHPEQRVHILETHGIRQVYYERIVWNALLAAWGQVFSLDLESTAWLMILLGIGTTLLIAWAAREMFGATSSLVSAALYTVHPLNVVWDVITIPDGLSVFFLAALLVAVSKLLKRPTQTAALAAGFFVMISFTTKIYYVLGGIAFVMVIVTDREALRYRVRAVLAFLGGAALAFGISTALCVMDTGKLFPYLDSVGEYQTVVVDMATGSQAPTFRQHVKTVLSRLEYGRWLFLDPGAFSGPAGLLGMFGIGYLMFRDRRVLVLGSVVVVFLLLLLWLPLSFRPLVFVEMRERYLTAILGPLCIVAAYLATECEQRIRGSTAGPAMAAVLVVLFGHTVLQTHDYTGRAYPRRYSMQFLALRPLLNRLPASGVRTVLFPLIYRRKLPQTYYSLGPEIEFVDFPLEIPFIDKPLRSSSESAPDEQQSMKAIARMLRDRPNSVLFIPRGRVGFETINKAFAYGGFQAEYLRDASLNHFCDPSEVDQFDVTWIRIPATATRQWLTKAGLLTGEGHHVGWLVRAKQSGKTQPPEGSGKTVPTTRGSQE